MGRITKKVVEYKKKEDKKVEKTCTTLINVKKAGGQQCESCKSEFPSNSQFEIEETMYARNNKTIVDSPEVENLMKEIYDICKKSGSVVFNLPNQHSVVFEYDEKTKSVIKKKIQQ